MQREKCGDIGQKMVQGFKITCQILLSPLNQIRSAVHPESPIQFKALILVLVMESI
jgi:hypothetical protein